VQPADADYLVQEAWLAVLRHPPAPQGARPEEQLRGYCVRLVRWKVANLRRWQRRHRAVDVDGLRGSDHEPAAPANDVAGGEEKDHDLERVLEALEQLPGGREGIYAQVVVLRYWGKKTVPEIAKALGKTPGQIKGYLRRALAALRRKLEIGS
jgi:RNA polymerase sigma factor (sigma-70 family)